MIINRSKLQLSVLVAVVLLVCGCAVSNRFASHRLLTQKQIVNEWIAKSRVPITYEAAIKEVQETGGNDLNANYIILPNDSDIPFDDIWRIFFSDVIPGCPCWLYTTPELDLKFYVFMPGDPAFPVTSRGLTLNLKSMYGTEWQAEDIYLVTDSIEHHYERPHLADAGWTEIGKNTFTFTIPPNTSGRERFWQVNLYNKNKKDDDWLALGPGPHEPEELETVVNNRHPVRSLLRFIQVTDSVNPESLNEEGYFIYSKLLPYPDKEWSE